MLISFPPAFNRQQLSRKEEFDIPKLHNRTANLFVLVVILSTAACTQVGPEYQEPPVAISETWETQGAKTDPADIVEWWTVFNDPVLNQLIEIAYHKNYNLQVAGLRVLEARAQLGIAVGNRYPQNQAFFGAATAIRASKSNANTGGGGDLRFGQLETGVGIGWEIDFWGRFQRGIESADANLAASIASYDDALMILFSQVASTYVAIRTSELQLRIALDNVELQQRSYTITEVNYRNGKEAELDVQQALALLRGTQSTVPGLEVAIRQSKNAMSTLLGRPVNSLSGILGSTSKVPANPPDFAIGVPADLLRRRPDIRQAELQAMAQTALVGVATADLYPSFVLSGTVGLSAATATDTTRSGDTGFSALFSGDSLQYAAGPSFSWNLFNYGRIKNNIRVQDARLQQLLVNYQNTVLRAAQEVEDSMIAYVKSLDERYLLVEAVGAAERSEVLSMLRYKEGFSGYQRVLDAQQRLVVQQQRQAANLGSIALNLISIYKALGGGWQVRENQPFVDTETQRTMQERTDWGQLLDPAATEPPEKPKAVRAPDW
ncbi:MAG: efflux transporter outer membrane subunit [bacterium]